MIVGIKALLGHKLRSGAKRVLGGFLDLFVELAPVCALSITAKVDRRIFVTILLSYLTVATFSCSVNSLAPVSSEQQAVAAPVLQDRISPAQQVTVSEGERIAFVARAHDEDGDLWGAEWYLDGQFLGAQHITSLTTGNGTMATFWRGINFQTKGNYLVEVITFDRAGFYSSPIDWQIRIIERPRALYVTNAKSIFAAAARSDFLDFANEYGVNTLILYGIDNHLRSLGIGAEASNSCVGQVSNDPRLPLADFIGSARQRGIRSIHIAIGVDDKSDNNSLESKLNTLYAFQCDFADASRSRVFDGAVTEQEFWKSESESAFEIFKTLVEGLIRLRESQSFEVSVYLGNRTIFDEQWKWIQPRVDRVLLTAYVDSPDKGLTNLEERLDAYTNITQTQKVWVVYSSEEEAEGRERCSKEPTQFMGDWFGEIGENHDEEQPLASAEKILLDNYRDSSAEWRNGIRLSGFAYYQDRYLRDYLTNGPNNLRSRAPSLCRKTTNCEERFDRTCVVQLEVGDSFTFWAEGWDEDSDLSGTEWYGQAGNPNVVYNSAGNPNVQYVSGTEGGTGKKALFGRRFQFLAPGEYQITAVVFDRQLLYGTHMNWSVLVE